MAIEICKIKSEKSTIPASRQPRSIPPNAARNGHDLDWQCLIFDGALPAHRARLIGFPFREHASSPPPALAHPFASRLGATQFTGGSALVGMYCTDSYLGYKTIPGYPARFRVPSPPGGGGFINPLTTRATGKHWFRSLTHLFYLCMRSLLNPSGLVPRDSRPPC